MQEEWQNMPLNVHLCLSHMLMMIGRGRFHKIWQNTAKRRFLWHLLFFSSSSSSSLCFIVSTISLNASDSFTLNTVLVLHRFTILFYECLFLCFCYVLVVFFALFIKNDWIFLFLSCSRSCCQFCFTSLLLSAHKPATRWQRKINDFKINVRWILVLTVFPYNI